jgi:hypothetical protein
MSDRVAELEAGIEQTPSSADTGGHIPENQRPGFSVADAIEQTKPEADLYPEGSAAQRGREIHEQWKAEQPQGPTQAEEDRQYVETDQTLQAINAVVEAAEEGDEDEQIQALLQLDPATRRSILDERFRGGWSIGRAGEDRPATFAEAAEMGRPRDAYGRFVGQS